MKYTYSIEYYFIDKWVKLLSETRDYCVGYLAACKYDAPRNAYRIMRSDGKVIEEISSAADVSIGMVAGWPTPGQYEAAAQRALDQAARIRRQNAEQDAKRAERQANKADMPTCSK
jgi:hypothetical protein